MKNTAEYGDYHILREGAKYNGVWLETQPLSGEIYAPFDQLAALNNQLIFMLCQRQDGKIPVGFHILDCGAV